MSTSTATCRCARTSNSPRHSASPRYTSDPSLCAVGHTTDARGCTGALPAGLWERRAGRPSGLPDASTPVGPERGGSGSSPRTRDHITDAAISLHWLRVPGRSQYKLAVLTYEILHVHGDAPRYLGPLSRVDDLPGRRTLRSANANHLVVPPVKLSTVGSQAFAVAAPHIWNTLPTDVVAASSLSTFRRLLKRFLFKQSCPYIIFWHHPASSPCSGCSTLKIYWLIDWLIDCNCLLTLKL